jgi:hypothetical protein
MKSKTLFLFCVVFFVVPFVLPQKGQSTALVQNSFLTASLVCLAIACATPNKKE